MRRIDYFFRETATGLRRNGTMAFAAMSTAFIALFLFGLALMIQREFKLWNYAVTGNVEVVTPPTLVGVLASGWQGLVPLLADDARYPFDGAVLDIADRSV